MRSYDGGQTWQDRVPTGPFDTHTLATHRLTPGRLYSAAGDGYFESVDYGDTWKQPDAGLRHYYLYGLAVHPKDTDTILVSAATGPWHAHNSSMAESTIYRKTAGQDWQPVNKGLPEPRGMIINTLAANPARPDEFYAANNRGIYHSSDSGLAWERLDIPWQPKYHSQHAWAIAVTEED